MIQGKIKVTWERSDYEHLPWQENENHAAKIISKVAVNPHNLGNLMCFDENLLGKFYDAVSEFELDKKVIAINKFRPGQMLPFHSDKYETYRKRNNIKENDVIQRVIVFLHDPKPGHQLWIKDKICMGPAGSYFAWEGETEHMAANLGIEDRYVLQLTGVKRNAGVNTNVPQEKLNDYYWKVWKPSYEKFKYSGWALLDKVEPTDQVLDIGCGFNLFKEKLGDRVYGIDPANPKADEMVTWEDYVPHKRFNVYFALGSLNFYPESKLFGHVKKLAETMQPGDRMYWRQNPGIGDHPWKEVKEVQDSFYPWTIDLNYQFGEQYNFEIKECKWDTGSRIYAEWIKK